MEKGIHFLRNNAYVLSPPGCLVKKHVPTLTIDGINFENPIGATEPIIKRAAIKNRTNICSDNRVLEDIWSLFETPQNVIKN